MNRQIPNLSLFLIFDDPMIYLKEDASCNLFFGWLIRMCIIISMQQLSISVHNTNRDHLLLSTNNAIRLLTLMISLQELKHLSVCPNHIILALWVVSLRTRYLTSFSYIIEKKEESINIAFQEPRTNITVLNRKINNVY